MSQPPEPVSPEPESPAPPGDGPTSRIDTVALVHDGWTPPARPFGPPRGPNRGRRSGDRPGSHPDAPPGYDILDVLGGGGMGVVYLARQAGLDRLVAIKTIHAGLVVYPKVIERFRNEARLVASLRHPNIVQVHQVGEFDPPDSRPFYVMEHVSGRTLDSILDDRTPHPRRAAEILASVADAIQYAHERGVIHRDMKPGNVILTDDGVAKVLDFGLGKRMEPGGMTEAGEVMGTASYMAPEQAIGDVATVGPAADIYSLGAMLYEFLSGRPPFEGGAHETLLIRVARDEPEPLSILAPDAPRGLAAIAMKCLAKKPERRYPSAGELAADLRRWLDGEPVAARHSEGMLLARRFLRRHRLRMIGWTAPLVLAFLYAALVDAGAPAPGADSMRDLIDRHGLSVLRPLPSDARVREGARQLRRRLSGGIAVATDRSSQRIRGMLAGGEYDPWSHFQATWGMLRAPENRARERLLVRGMRSAFEDRVTADDGRDLGWIGHPLDDFTLSPPSFFAIMSLARAIRIDGSRREAEAASAGAEGSGAAHGASGATRPGDEAAGAAGATPEPRPALLPDAQDDLATEPAADMLFDALEYAQRAAESYRGTDGGWNLFPDQIDRSDSSVYATSLALLSLCELHESALGWRGSLSERDRRIEETVRWLLAAHDPRLAPPGWGGKGEDAGLRYDGLTLQNHAALLMARRLAGVELPSSMLLREIPDRIVECGTRSAEHEAVKGETNAEFVDQEGRRRMGSETTHFLWYPWAIASACEWLRAAPEIGASPESVARVRRALGRLVLGIGDDAVDLALSGMTYPAAETLGGLSFVPPPDSARP